MKKRVIMCSKMEACTVAAARCWMRCPCEGHTCIVRVVKWKSVVCVVKWSRVKCVVRGGKRLWKKGKTGNKNSREAVAARKVRVGLVPIKTTNLITSLHVCARKKPVACACERKKKKRRRKGKFNIHLCPGVYGLKTEMHFFLFSYAYASARCMFVCASVCDLTPVRSLLTPVCVPTDIYMYTYIHTYMHNIHTYTQTHTLSLALSRSLSLSLSLSLAHTHTNTRKRTVGHESERATDSGWWLIITVLLKKKQDHRPWEWERDETPGGGSWGLLAAST